LSAEHLRGTPLRRGYGLLAPLALPAFQGNAELPASRLELPRNE
jgi:hypothetical protein